MQTRSKCIFLLNLNNLSNAFRVKKRHNPVQGLNVTAKGTDFSNYMTKRKYHNIHKGLRQPIKKGTHYKKKQVYQP